MPTLAEYFESEARDYLAQLDRELARPQPSPAELHRAARALRGSAQMAREERMLRAAGALEAAARALLDNVVPWSDDVGGRARQTIADLRALLERRNADDVLDHATEAVVARWRHAGVGAAAPLRLHGATPGELRAFAAREVTGIIEALEHGVQQLTAAPMDREPLKMILRRQRALLGAARLDEIPVVAEILRAVDDLTRVIAKLDVGVKREWLDIYRVAREALKAAVEPLLRDENPPPTHALSRLRHMRAELLERYGTGDVVSAAHTTQGFTTAAAVQQLPQPSYVPAPPAAPLHADNLGDEPLLLAEADVVGDDEPDLLLLDDEAVAEADLLLLDEPEDSADILLLDDVAAPVAEPAAAVEDEAVLELAEAAVLQLSEEVLLELPADAVVEDGPADMRNTSAAEEGPRVVPIESLLYHRDDALRRALQLRDLIAVADRSDDSTRAALEELFDLINLALH